jgi:hypothetical protein
VSPCALGQKILFKTVGVNYIQFKLDFLGFWSILMREALFISHNAPILPWEKTMNRPASSNDNGGFVIGQHYEFDPPVTTNAAPPGGDWTRRTFRSGKCMRYADNAKAHMFVGTPVDEDKPYIFAVAWGGGSIAKEVPDPVR